jgi:hypothetical protein
MWTCNTHYWFVILEPDQCTGFAEPAIGSKQAPTFKPPLREETLSAPATIRMTHCFPTNAHNSLNQAQRFNDNWKATAKSHPPVGQPWPSRAQGRWHKDLAWNLGTFSKMKNLRLGSTRTQSRLTSLRGVIYHHYYAHRPAVGTDSTRRGGGFKALRPPSNGRYWSHRSGVQRIRLNTYRPSVGTNSARCSTPGLNTHRPAVGSDSTDCWTQGPNTHHPAVGVYSAHRSVHRIVVSLAESVLGMCVSRATHARDSGESSTCHQRFLVSPSSLASGVGGRTKREGS